MKNTVKKQKIKKKSISSPRKEHVLVVSQEIKFARLLAGNEQKTRDRALKSLKKWLLNCFQKEYEFKEDDFTRIWKGLFYAVWMSDKPLVQEELCESISSLLDEFPAERLPAALMLTHVGLQTLALNWYGLDSHRIDKFLMLVRRYLRASLRCLNRSSWSVPACEQYGAMLSDGLLALRTPDYARNSASMVVHVVECFLEEVAKVSEGSIAPDSLAALLHPFITYMCSGPVHGISAACRRLLTALLRQSDEGIEYTERVKAWERMGCPEGGPDALELESGDEGEGGGSGEDEDGEQYSEAPTALDPRAGRVDVLLPTLPVPCRAIVAQLRQLLPSLRSKAHQRATICMQRFEKLSLRQYPLAVEPPPPPDTDGATRAPQACASSLLALERALVEQADELSLRGLSRKHRKRLLAKSRAGLSIVDDVTGANTANDGNMNGNWQIEETEPTAKKAKKQDADKENVIVKKNKKSQRIEKQNGVTSKKRKLDTPDTTSTQKAKLLSKKQKIAANAEKSDNNTTNVMKVDSKTINDVKSPMKMANGVKSQMKITNAVAKTKTSPVSIKEKSKKNNLKSIKERTKNLSAKKSLTEKKSNKDMVNKQKNTENKKKISPPTVIAKKVKNFQKQLSPKQPTFTKPEKTGNKISITPKKVKFVLKNNSMQGPVDYFKSVRQSPSIPFDSSKKPVKTNLKPSLPSPINPFFKKKMKLKKL